MSVRQKRCPLPLPSAEAIAGNEDLMIQVLVRLPPKSLGRFKCVSKRWNSLISDPHFSFLCKPQPVSGYFVLNSPLPILYSSIYSLEREPIYKYVSLIGKRPRISTLKPFTFVGEGDVVIIMDSCNGLLLLGVTNLDSCRYSFTATSSNYFVYNPTTKQFADIPFPLPNQCASSSVLAFEPSRAPHYKIVRLLESYSNLLDRLFSDFTYQIEIYSTETGAWRFSGDPFTARLMDNAVFFNNTIHWLSKYLEFLLLFDVDEESFRRIPMSTISDIGGKREIKYFGESRCHLNLIYCDGDGNTLNVLEMESDYSKWLLKYRIHLHDIAARIRQFAGFNQLFILHLLIPEVEKESSLVFYTPGMVVSYNFKDKTLKKLGKYLERHERWIEAYPYIESLVRI